MYGPHSACTPSTGKGNFSGCGEKTSCRPRSRIFSRSEKSAWASPAGQRDKAQRAIDRTWEPDYTGVRWVCAEEDRERPGITFVGPGVVEMLRLSGLGTYDPLGEVAP